LLKGEITVNSHEDIEVFGSSSEQFTILDSGPTRLRRRHNLVFEKSASESLWHAFIQKNFHTAFTDGKISPLTSSNNSTT